MRFLWHLRVLALMFMNIQIVQIVISFICLPCYVGAQKIARALQSNNKLFSSRIDECFTTKRFIEKLLNYSQHPQEQLRSVPTITNRNHLISQHCNDDLLLVDDEEGKNSKHRENCKLLKWAKEKQFSECIHYSEKKRRNKIFMMQYFSLQLQFI